MIATIDLHFQGQPQVIAAYVLRGPHGVALVETGPASCYPALKAGLRALGIEVSEIRDILLTHIHLDHAGAAGWLARESGATVHVHAVGAPHLADPSKLLGSAQRIYGDAMDQLWGKTVAVPAQQIHALQDGDTVRVAGERVRALNTPGHAWHHMAYLLDEACFTGDVAGVSFPALNHVRVPTPPPEIDVEAWQASLARLIEARPMQLYPTHFGAVTGDSTAHLRCVEETLLAAAAFVDVRRADGQDSAEIISAFTEWAAGRAAADGADQAAAERFELIVPSTMCVQGLLRYWQKRA
ncbi:MAG: MBL fold metallo-hydrolase [Caldilineales bacterium]